MNSKNLNFSSVYDTLKVAIQYCIPHHFLSRIVHRLMRSQNHAWKTNFTRLFIYLYKINVSEAQNQDLASYRDFNSFFTRSLKPELRPISKQQNHIVSPVDGTVSQIGNILEDSLIQAKGRLYNLTDLLGGRTDLSHRFENGHFTTLYLSPMDYHRIHMPCTGTLEEMIHVPGRLFSVSPATTRVVPGLFARNERVITLFQTEFGSVAVILVGAIFVASIETVWQGEITPPAGHINRTWKYDHINQVVLDKGLELGRFNMGSTVILLFQHGKIAWSPTLSAEQSVKMGQTIALAN